MKPILKILGEDHIDQTFAVQNNIISDRTIRSLRDTIPIKIGDRRLLPINSLSPTVQNRIKKRKIEFEKGIAEPDLTAQALQVKFILLFILEQPKKFKPYSKYYKKFLFKENELERYLRTHAIVESLLSFKQEGYTILSLYNAFRQLPSSISLVNFKCKNYDYFTAKLKEAEEIGIENLIVNEKRFKTIERKKFTIIHEKFAIFFYKDPCRFKYKVILEKVNNEAIKRGLLPIKIGVLKRFFAQKEIQNRYKPFRLGKKWAKENLLFYLPRLKPKRVNSKWEIDSTDLNFYVWEDENSNFPIRYTLCIVVDVKSRKILAYHLARTEDTELNEVTLFKAVIFTNSIPIELVHDNGSGLVSDRFKELESRMEELGCSITLCKVGEPQQKGTVELVHNLLNINYFCYLPGWLGCNSGSVLDENRISSELQNKLYNGLHKLYLKDAVLMVDDIIKKFNDTDYDA